jgi:type IV pilus assembly protein PilM
MGAPETVVPIRPSRWREALARTAAAATARPIGPIGAEFADGAVHLAQVERGPAGLVLRAAASVPYEGERTALFADPRRLRTLLRGALARGGFSGCTIASALPSGLVRTMVVNYKAESEAQVTAAVVAVVRERLKGDLDQSVLDFAPVRLADDAKGSGSAIVAVASRAEVTSWCDRLRAGGVVPGALDLPAAALARLARASTGPGADSALVLRMQADSSFIVAMYGGRLIVLREIEIGRRRLLDALAGALDLDSASAAALLRGDTAWHGEPDAGLPDAAEAARVVGDVLRPVLTDLVAEIDRTLVYLASKTRGGTVGTLYLDGHAAAYPSVANHVRRHLGLPVEVLDPARILVPGPRVAADPGAAVGPDLALACGLALRGAVRLG